MGKGPQSILFTPDVSLAATMPRPDDLSFDRLYDANCKKHGEGALVIGRVSDLVAFAQATRWGFNLVTQIKDAGEREHRIPEGYVQFLPALQMIAAYEARYSPLMLHKEAWLTIRQWQLNKGGAHVANDWHTDGASTDKESHPLVEHVYTVCDSSPTLMQARPLKDAFNRLAGKTAPETGLVVQNRPGDIALMTNYCWHSTAPAEGDGVRTFLRLTYQSPLKSDLRP